MCFFTTVRFFGRRIFYFKKCSSLVFHYSQRSTSGCTHCLHDCRSCPAQVRAQDPPHRVRHRGLPRLHRPRHVHVPRDAGGHDCCKSGPWHDRRHAYAGRNYLCELSIVYCHIIHVKVNA